MADKVTSLYNALKADGLFKQARSLNDFKAKMAYQGYRSQIYKLARDKGANVGTFSQFTNALGYSSGSPKPRRSYGSYQPQQQKQEENTVMTTAQRAMQVPYRQNTQLGKAPKSAPKNASPFVQSLYEIDDAQKGAGYPVDYTSPKATQQVYQRNQRVRRQAAKTAARKINRQASHAQPIMQTNTPADTYIGKTEGQLMDEMNQSANALVGSEMGDYLDKVIGDEFKAAHARGLAVLSANSGVHGTGGADWWIGERAYQNQMDQDKQLQEITGNIQKNIESIFSDPKVKQRVLSDARRLGVSPEAYIESSLAPALIEKAGEQFNKTQLNRMMAKGASDYIASGILNSLTGTLLTGLTSTKSQRQMQQQADAMTEEGLNPNYKPGTWAKAAKGAVAFAADAPWYNLAGYGAGALTGKVFGNAAQQMARMANQSLRQRVFEGVARGVVHGGATGFQYGAINGAVQNYSTGEDTSLWGTLKAAAKGGLEEGVSFATMEGMGGAVGAFGHGIGLKGTEKTWKQRVNKMGQKLTYEGIKTGMEGIGMATGGVASSYANHILTGDDWHGFSTEGTLESCASAVIFKLTHAKDLFKKETDRNGKPFSFTSNIAQKTARFFLSGEAKSAPHVFSDEEKHQLFAAGSELGMKPMENIVSWAKQAKKYRAEDIEKSEDGSDLLNNYQQIMQDPNVSWDAKAKFTTMVMGTMPESRPMMDHISYGTEEGTDGDNRIHTYKTINEYASDGTLLSKHRFDTKDKRESIIYEIGVRKEELRSKNALALLVGLDRNNYDLQNAFFKENAKDWEQVQGIVEGMQTGGSKIDHQFTEYVLNSERGSFLPIVDAVANKNGMDREGMLKAFDKDPMKRTDAEQNACVQLRKAIEMEVFPANKVHEEQSSMDGKDVATDNSLGTEQPNGEAVKAELNGLKQAEDEMDALIRDNDVFGQNFQRLKQQGLTNPQIYDWMVQQGGLTVEQLEPFAHYINANARVQGMQEATKNAIDQHVSSYVQDWTFHGTLNGQEAKGEQAIFVQDRDGRTLILGSGEIAFEHSTSGRTKEGVGDMIVCLDPNTHDVVYLKSDEVTLSQTQDAENFGNEYRQKLQMINSQPYNEAAQKQAMIDAAKPQQEEKVPQDNTTKSEVDTTSGKDNTTSEDLVPQEQPQPTRKFADGSDVPMTKDSKGRPTPDYEKMTPEQSAEILTEDFGENAEKVVDGQIQKAEKALKDAEKMKVDYTAEPNDIMEQEALKNQTIEAAKSQLAHAKNIKKTMTAKKVAETVGNTEQAEGAHEAGSVAAQKFANAPRLVGNKRTRMLADGETKIKGHYEIVPAESLTPSHDVNNGYKKSKGFPTDAEGRTVNDRDYEHDKAAQQNTDQIARKYNGMAIEQVPVVSDEGIVYDGNGRTMAGQKAAKEGTDGEYINDLLENAENFGFTREQIEQSGIEHPRLVLVTDERLPYDTATFSKFNRNEKKTQSNTEQAVAKAKTLTSDEVGAIVAEIEGSGSLDAFFNNSKAINDLVKTLVDKGIIGQNEVAQMMDNPERLSAQGREYVKNLLLGSIFKPETIRMLGIDSAVKNKAVNAIRSVMDNMKLGDYSLRDEIDQAIQLLYEARRGGNKVDTLLRTPDMFGEDAAKRYPSISQMMALALEGKVADFRDLLDEYNRIAASRNTGEGNMFEAAPTKKELINEFLNFKKWQDYGTGHSEIEGGNDVSGDEEPQQEASGGNGVKPERNGEWFDQSVEKLKTVKGEERKQLLDEMAEYVTEFAKKNGYSKPEVYKTKEELLADAKDPVQRKNIENFLRIGGYYPAYYEDGKIHLYIEGIEDSKELVKSFAHEYVHKDNDEDPSRVSAIVYAVVESGEIKRTDLLDAIYRVCGDQTYRNEAERMAFSGEDPLPMLADEALAHIVQEIYTGGKDVVSQITANPTLQKIALDAYNFRENERRSNERHSEVRDEESERKNSNSEGSKTNLRPISEGGIEQSETNTGRSNESGVRGVRESDEGKSNSVGFSPKTEPSADPIEGIEKAADAFRKEQKQKGEFVMNLKLGKARQEYAEAKERGDASEIKRTRDELKQLLDEHYKAQHMGLVQRRKEIAKEIGMTEAKKIDKPWSEMDGEERMATAEKSPLTEDEIRSNTSEENQDLIEDAIDYLNGNHGFAQQLAYLKIYEDVRNRHENATDNSGAENGAQLAPADNGIGEGLGLGTGRESGGTDGQLDRGTGNESAPGEPERREGDQNDSTLSVGKSGDKQGEGNSSDMGAVPAGNTDTKGSSSTGKDGNVSEQGGRGGSNRPTKPDAKRKPAAKQGTTWRGRTEAEIKQEHKEAKAGLKAALAEMLKRGRGEVSLSLVGLNSKQIEYVPELMKAVKRYGMSLIDQGIYKIKDWMNSIREGIHDEMKEIGFSDQDIDDFIKEMWNSKMTMDGETHTIAEWCSIYGNQKLREKLGEELDIKYQKQMDAEPIEVKIGDRKNIEETLPFLLPQQQDDVLKAETQFFGKDHTDREHAYGKGYMFTNGTGTGKTYTGLGIAKRLAKQGKGRILFITPSQKKVNDWMKDGKNLGLDIRDLDSVAKEKGTTATTESGDGMVITTFANFGLNKKLLETEWDAVIYDECHRIMENKKGAETARSMQHYMMTNRDENHCFLRLQTINPHYQKMKNAADRFNELRQKEVQRIQKEYKQSHPSATAKDVVNATFSQLPKELNSFALADATAFPKLGKAYQDFTSAKQHYYNNVEPKLKEQAKSTWKNTKTIFLSATPFNTRENLDYAEGYIFKFPEDDGSRMSGRSRFYLDHFGAAYRYRYNRLEAKTDNPAAVAKQEVAFSDYLQDTLGTMSGRIIDSAYDYSRDFPTVAPDHADEFNNAVEEAVKGRYLGEAYSRTIGDYNYGSALFETMKVANIIQRMKDHLAAGRKIVVFHRRVETKNPIQPPFAYMLDYANRMIAEMKPGKERNEAIKECTEFRNKYADLLDWEQTLDYSMPREQIAKVFGKDNVLFFSGKESKKVKDKAVDTFNDDNSGKNIIVIQEASGKEGISLHDVTGNHQRVLITLGLPQSPITALQIEGRTYRIGNKSNAIFEYPILGLNSEMMLFGQKFNNQVSTTENLALGSQARNLRDSFANGILEHSGIIPIDQQGVGGKEFDAPKQSDSDPFDDAVLDYYSNQKLNRNNREGVDYFPTPEPLGYKMVEWANMGEGDTALEPSAGHGAIARYVSKSNELLSIEPSQSLFAKLQLKAGGLGRKFLNSTFENYNVANKHDVVVMNPPFGTAGATAIAHLDKAFRHLDEGGRVVAIIPRGSTDKKFDKWYGEQKNVAMRAEVDLPDIVFQQAGTNVRCRVVVLDKITDNALRSKAGYPEKIDLSGHYDKIEDFFEDLRDVQMPDRIIDTQMKSMKKARTFKKDIEDIKGMTVTIEKNGISVFDKNAYRDYSISFPSIKHNEEWTKENYSKVYERFDQEQNRVYSENSKAALDEMKKLACKLAGMSEEEMQRYIASKNNGGTHFREPRGLQYSKSDTKDVKNSRIIPEDVDKNVSSQIEKKFDDEVNSAKKELGITDGSFDKLIEDKVRLYADLPESEIIKDLEYESNKTSQSGVLGQENPKLHNERSRRAEHQAARIAAKRELDYRKVRKSVLENDYGLRQGDVLSPIQIEKCFKTILAKQGESEEIGHLFNKAIDICKRIGLRFNVLGESKNGSLGYSTTDREVGFNIDDLTKTKISSKELPVTILHEILHQITLGSIDLVKRGKADGILTPKQIEAVNSILDIYNKVKDNRKQFEENTYGLTDEYEFAAQMADPRQRKALDLDIWDRIKNAAKELANKGDRSLWQTFKDAIKRLFEISDKDKMDEALNTIMDDFNETIDDISMNEIEQDGFAYKLDNEEDRKLFDSLNNKRNTRKEYNDTVTELARRMAEGDRSISERTTGGMEETEKSISSGREDWRGASMGRSYAGFNIRPKSIAHCAADIIANDVSRRGRTQRLSSTRTGLELGQKGSMEDSATDTTREISSWELTDQRVASVGEREVSSRIENWAKQNNAWFDWRTLRGRFDRNERLGTGDEAESDVFLSKDGKSVLKIVRNPHAIYDTLQGKLDSIALHNELFPTDAMNVIGFTKVNEDGFPITSILLEQPFIEGKTVWDSFGTKEERMKFRDNFMKSLGFTKEKWAATSGIFEGVPDDIWRKGDYAVEDVNAGNIIIDKNGKGHIIDCVVSKYNDAIKDKIVYDSTEEKKQIQAENKAVVERLRKEVKNQKLRLEALQEARNENNKDKIDEFIVDAKNKIADFEKQIKEKQNAIHFREEENDSPVKISNEAPVVVKHIAEVAKKVGAKVQMVSSVDEITNKAAKAAIEEGRKITGWYDEKTGEVHLYMPNIHDRYTAEKTIWHETVGHKGMRGLMGESFDKFLDSVWYDLDKPENAGLKKLVAEEMKYSPLDYRNAIEEGIARMAEDGKGEAGFWNNIRNKVTDFLHEIGYRIAPNTKDVKYLLWLSKNLQKNPNDPYWKLRAEAVKYRLDHEDIRSVVSRDGVFYENDGKARSLADLPKADYQEATDGQIHFRTTPTAATALDRYHHLLDAHGYMATESYMDNMLSLKKLMNAIVPDKKIEDIASSENPYILQNVMQGAMSNASKMFEINIMSPLEKAMAGVLDAFEGKKTDDKIRNFNLYMITKHGLERNRVLFVRDAVRKLRMDDSTKADAEKLQSEWGAKKEDLGNQLKSGIIDLKRYYEKMDEWIRDNVNKDYEAGEHDYSGMHGVQDIISMKDPYNDGEAIQSVMDSEAKMESVKAGSVRDYWGKVRAATRYSVDSDYNNGIIDRDLHGHVSKMFDWYVPLRNYDETTAEDVYGYITEIGDPKNRIGSTLAKARGHKYLSETNILAQIGALGNRAIKNGGDNAIKQAFARFARNHSDNNLVKETSVWYVKDPTTGIVEERYPDIPEGATADEINQIVSDFDTDMTMLKAQGLATKKFDRGNIGYRFERAKDKSQHIVDVMIAGKKHSFVILGNPRAAQALNGMLEHKNESLAGRTTAAISRFMAQTCTSYNPEFVMRNMIRDFEFASTNLLAKEGMAYTKTFEKYYAQVGLIEGIRNTKLSDFKKMTGFGLFSKYRNGTLDTSDKIQRYFKEFMENGGETGWVQIKNMKDLTAEYKLHVKTEKNGKARVSKNVFDFIFKNLENANEVAENLARFATYCASRDAGRSAVRSAYDAKEVSVNFNRHGSGNAIYSFKNGEMSNAKTARKNVYGFWASWFRNSSMFFNAGVQSTNLLIKNFKNNKAGTIGYIMAGPMMSGMAMALINNMLIASEDEKDRKGVKDPYGELPDYIRRNNLCIYVGGGEFITIPLAIEERAFYGLGDLAAGLTFSKNISSQKMPNLTENKDIDKYLNPFMDAVGCISQLVPVADYLGNASFGKNPGEETFKAIAPSATSPIFEWFFNSDWKGAPIHRENKFDENQPSWMLAYKGTPEWLININKKANAWSNDVAPGNENMKGNDFLDAATDPSLLQHLYSSYLGGAATFMERVGGLVKKGKDTETKDIPFVRSLFYTPSEQTSLQRTKSKWYNYLDETEKARSNVKRLKSKNVPVDELVRNYGDYFKFKQSKDAEKINVIEAADKQMREWKKLRNKSGDTESINFANQNIDNIMMRAVDELDKLN